MFQPQPTPFAFAAYGVREDIPDYSYHEQAPPLGSGPSVGGASGPLIFTTPAFSNSGLSSGSSSLFDTSNQHSPHSAVKMEPNTQDDLAAQEAAAREYRPKLQGPLIGEKMPSHVITEEYAKADQVYVAKTIALPETYSSYRPVQGDGNCGWRAIGYGYFETLIQQGDVALVQSQLQRLTALNQYLSSVGGYDDMVYEPMSEETIELLGDIAANMVDPLTAMSILTNKFNDPNSANSIIYHLRLLAASWLRENAETYEAFTAAEGGIQPYCNDVLERVDREIEHLGIVSLVNILLKPVGFVLEIAYLDRSPGSQVNTYRFPEEANNQDPMTLGPMIYLLFRPDHYDILYRRPLSSVDIQVNRVSFSQRHGMSTGGLDTYPSVDLSPLAMLPGFGTTTNGLSSLALSGGSPLDYTPSPTSPWFSQPYTDPTPPPPRQHQPAPPPPSQQQSTTTPTTHTIRFSPWNFGNFEATEPSTPWQEPTFQTNTFRNSHFNTAHFNNPNFQPEEYKPGADDGYERTDGRSGRKRSHGKASTHSGDDW